MNSDALGELDDSEIITARRKAFGAGAPAAEDVPPTPLADVGVLLVHGIGNHREGVTLRAFGQPLLDWLKDWLRGKGAEHARGDVVVSEARFNDAEAPAYALAQVSGVDRDSSEKSQESWLFCEGWWGSTVQSPASLQLLRWMWTRGPLLIYWHFFIRQTAGEKSKQTDMLFGLLALLLAGFSQVVIGIAMLLWLIPIGPWRQKVVAAVRVLTLTLGDSYVLEEDIQRAALVERVRRALDWLTKRTKKTVVIAHSQGGAIAHEVLRQSAPDNLSMFITVGSGLEKLHFLREVVSGRRGLIVAWLIFPLAAAGGAMALCAVSSTAERWEIGLGVTLLFVALVLASALIVLLQDYKKQLSKAVPALELPGLGHERWIDIYASDDVVPMNRGSLLDKAHFLVRKKVYNERSYVRDHVAYFTNVNDCVPRLWEELEGLSRLRLFNPGDEERLGRFARVHKAYAHIISFSRLALFIAVFFSGYVLRNSLLGFGDSVLKSVEGTVVGDWLKPVRGLAGMLASLLKRVWKADIKPDMLANALFGALVLLGAIVLWWTIFHAFWLSRCAARSRQACRRDDVLNTRFARFGFFVLCIVFLCFGCLPLIVSIILAAAPDLTVATVGKAIAVTLSGFALIFGLFFAVCLPVGAEKIWQDREQPWHQRIFSVPASVLLIGALLLVARWLWPWKISPAVQTAVLVVFVMAMALAWQVYGILKVRKDSRLIWGATIITLPILGAASCFWLRFSQPYLSAVLTYFGLAAAVLISIFCLRYFKIITA